MLNFIFSPWWPFLVLGLVVIVLGVLAYLYPAWRGERWEMISVGTSLITAAAAVSIPIVLHRNARDTRTLEVLNDVSRQISDVVAKKRELDEANQKKGNDRFKSDYISNDGRAEALVIKLLNEYEYVCLGGNERLLSNNIIRNLRWDALVETRQDYDEYIRWRRAQGGNRRFAWVQCDVWLRKNPRQ